MRKICNGAKEYSTELPKSGLGEHNPMEILSSQLEVAKSVLHETGISAQQISAIGITNQKRNYHCVENTGKPAYPLIVWKCSRVARNSWHSGKRCCLADVIRSKTGLIPDAYFSDESAMDFRKMCEAHRNRQKKGNLLFGTVDTWFIGT